jgi:porin
MKVQPKKNFNYMVLLMFFVSKALLLTIVPCQAQEQNSETVDTGGIKNFLAAKGVNTQFNINTDTFRVLDGGIKQGFTRYNFIESITEFDVEKMGLWSNGRFFLYMIRDFGNFPTQYVGDINAVDNFSGSKSFFIYESWYEHRFYNGKFTWLAGLKDVSLDFATMVYSFSFLNGGFQMSPTFWSLGISTYPFTSIGSLVRYNPTEKTYVQLGAYDGFGGDADRPSRTHIVLDKKDGVLYVSEAGIVSSEAEAPTNFYKFGLGGFYHTREFQTFKNETVNSNYGLYAIGEKLIYAEDSEGQGLGIFGNVSYSSSSRNQFDRFFSVGLNYTGLFPTRDVDVTSFGVLKLYNSDDFTAVNPDALAAESVIELSHRFQLTPNIALQPDIQYVKNPGLSKNIDSAIVIGSRLQLSF